MDQSSRRRPSRAAAVDLGVSTRNVARLYRLPGRTTAFPGRTPVSIWAAARPRGLSVHNVNRQRTAHVWDH